MRKTMLAVIMIGAVLTLSACRETDRQTDVEKFNAFITHFENGKSDKVRITMYTTEGDPIFYNLDYDGKKIKYTFDNSKDAFGGKGKGKQSTTCVNLEKKANDRGTAYTLSGCSGDNSGIGESFYFLVPTSTVR